MRQFTLNMNIKYQRPIVELKSWHNFEALLDTGAFFPVWTVDETILEMLGGTFLRKDITFSGFGGRTKGNLYKLQSMVIGDLIFPNTHIIACKDLQDVPFQLILSATMFQNLNLTLPNCERRI